MQWMDSSFEPRQLNSLIVLRSILFLRFRVTVREVMEPLLSEKVPQLDDGKFKGANLLANKENIDRDVDYTFFLKQLKKDMESGRLDSFFLENNAFPLKEEFYETCEYALHGDREFFLNSRPTDTYYMKEEISFICDIEFLKEFDHEAVIEEIVKFDPSYHRFLDNSYNSRHDWCPEAEVKCRKIASYLVILLSIK